MIKYILSIKDDCVHEDREASTQRWLTSNFSNMDFEWELQTKLPFETVAVVTTETTDVERAILRWYAYSDDLSAPFPSGTLLAWRGQRESVNA